MAYCAYARITNEWLITMQKISQDLDQDTLLTRAATARALTEAGFPIAPATLASMASRTGGPPFHQFGGIKALVPWETSLAWARAHLSRRVTCTSEFDAA